MNLFFGSKTHGAPAVIIGCGRLGSTLAAALYEKGSAVTVIDRSKDAFQKLSPSFKGRTIAGNATDLEVLAQARIVLESTVLCVTNSENFNILAAQLVKSLFSAGRVIARIYDPEKACVYEEQGIETVCPSTLSVEAVYRMLHDESPGETVQKPSAADTKINTEEPA